MITSTTISIGDQLGAQMNTLAELFFIAKENNQQLVFFDEFKNFRRGYQFLDVFDLRDVKIIKFNNLLIKFLAFFISDRNYKKLNWKNKMKNIYFNKISKIKIYVFSIIRKLNLDFIPMNDLKNDVNCDKKLLDLNIKKNYDITSGFGTYQDWKKYESEIIKMFSFKESIINDAKQTTYYNQIINSNSVSLHFRRTDYLVLSSLNLSIDYYKKAISYFDKRHNFFVFSDDIDSIKELKLFGNEYNVTYVNGNIPGVDMYLMSKCKNNIVANSTFSVWGGVLNKNKNKKVICPHDFIGKSAPDYLYINGNYYPNDWIAI